MITQRELIKFALVGIIVRIDAEKEKLNKATEDSRKADLQSRIDIMTEQYNELLKILHDCE